MKKNLFTLLCVTFMFMLMSSCSTVEPPIEPNPETKTISRVPCQWCMGDEWSGHQDWCDGRACPICKKADRPGHECDVSLCPDCGKIEGPFCCPVLWRCPDCMQAPHAEWCGPCSVCGEMKTERLCCPILLCGKCGTGIIPGTSHFCKLKPIPICKNPSTCGKPGYISCCKLLPGIPL